MLFSGIIKHFLGKSTLHLPFRWYSFVHIRFIYVMGWQKVFCDNRIKRCKKSIYFTCATWKAMKQVFLFIKNMAPGLPPFHVISTCKGHCKNIFSTLWYLSKKLLDSMIRAVTLERFHIVMHRYTAFLWSGFLWN